jgi:NADPH:quinone reductase-like Zn-dependent oxidoreductase
MPASCISIPAAGGYDKLQLLRLEEGASTKGANLTIPEEELVVVETAFAGVNYADCCVRWGLYASAKEYVGWPITPGFGTHHNRCISQHY